jgi:hypothetical protein
MGNAIIACFPIQWVCGVIQFNTQSDKTGGTDASNVKTGTSRMVSQVFLLEPSDESFPKSLP